MASNYQKQQKQDAKTITNKIKAKYFGSSSKTIHNIKSKLNKKVQY